jgi:hypothetical protein
LRPRMGGSNSVLGNGIVTMINWFQWKKSKNSRLEMLKPKPICHIRGHLQA